METHDPTAQELESSIASLIAYLGDVPGRAGIEKTPARFIKALKEMTEGYQQDPKTILSTTFDVEYDEMVIVNNITFVSLCEHHILPFAGTATVGYIPTNRVVGLSKIPRLVLAFAKRLQVQERMSRQIAEAMMEILQPQGVGVILKAKHSCMGCRGVKQPGAEMITSCLLGNFKSDEKTRSEFLSFSPKNT